VERNAEQLAWTVLIAAFATFCMLLVAVPTGVNWYLAQAMADRPVRLQVLKGTTLWLPAGGRQEVNAGGLLSLNGGEQIRTAADSEALLSFFDGSNVHLWPNTTIRLLATKSSAYRFSDTQFVLAQDAGHARYEVAIPATTSRKFEVDTPQASTLLREGRYRIEVSSDRTSATVTTGSATVIGAHQAVEVLKGEWTDVAAAGPPSRPASDVHNLIANGEFSLGLESWQPGSRGDVADVQPGHVITREQDNRSFVEFARDDAQRYGETFLHKSIGQDVTDYGLLRLNFQLRILAQSTVEGGPFGPEYPLLVRVHYRDSSGTEATWTHEFYVGIDDSHSLPDTTAMIESQWTDETFDLFDPSMVTPRPSEILWIEYAATGRSYRSDLGNVQLLVD
jgi:hypothetical protein